MIHFLKVGRSSEPPVFEWLRVLCVLKLGVEACQEAKRLLKEAENACTRKDFRCGKFDEH